MYFQKGLFDPFFIYIFLINLDALIECFVEFITYTPLSFGRLLLQFVLLGFFCRTDLLKKNTQIRSI